MECIRSSSSARAAPWASARALVGARRHPGASRTAHPVRASSQQQQATQATTLIGERPKQSAAAPPAVVAVAGESTSSSSAAPVLGSWTVSLGNLLLLRQLADILLQQQPSTSSSPPSVGVTAAVHHPATCAIALGLFALISYDVIAPSSAHLLPHMDAAVHQWVVAHTDAAFRATTADLFVSDLFITAGIWGWLATSCITLTAAPRAAALPLGVAWLAYYTTCGAVLTDPPLVHALKQAFGRVRPSTLHHTFSFPSGHTSAAVFIAGMLLVVLLPLASAALQSAQRRLARRHSKLSRVVAADLAASHSHQLQPPQQQQQQQQEEGVLSHTITTLPVVAAAAAVSSLVTDHHAAAAPTGNQVTALESTHAVAGQQQQQQQEEEADEEHRHKHRLDWSTAWLSDGVVVGLWGAAWGLTATGRVLADAHWVSDTLAGGCLAVGVVSGVACTTQWLANHKTQP